MDTRELPQSLRSAPLGRPGYSNEKLGFSVSEAAYKSGFGRDMIYRAIREKKLAALKFGRRTIITEDELRRFMSGLPRLEL